MTDTTKVNQYQDQVVEAVGTIVRKAVESISFDKTIVCTIKDDSGRENGEYIVTDGSSTFSAYSYDTSLRNGNSVYVTVPEGNYDNEKLIIGKRKSGTSVSYSYKEPFNRIVDLTGNLAAIDDPVGLICNKESSGISYKPQSIPIYENNLIEEQDNQYTGFNYIGLKADFRTIMNNAVQGEYGLKLIITVKRYLTESEIKSYNDKIKELQERINEIQNQLKKPAINVDFGKIQKLKEELESLEKQIANLEVNISEKCKYLEYECRLSSNKDMFGNPYAFYIYQEQQAIFPINPEDIITKYYIELYENGKFIDVNQQLINKPTDIDGNKQSATTIDGEIVQQTEAEQKNIFVNNVYLCAGIDAENIYNEYLSLYTFSSPTYYNANEEKVVNLRWMKKNDKGIFEDVIPEKKEETIQLAELDEESGKTSAEEEVETTVENDIRWYRYRLGAPAADQFCGVYWERQDPKVLRQLVFNPSLNYQEEKIKVIIVEITKDKNGNIIDEKVISRSDILVFENEIHSDMYNSVEGLEGIYLSFDDGSNGDYYLYNQGNQLIDKSQGQKVRTAKLWEKLNGNSSQVNLEDCSTITWKLPIKNTMLSFSYGESDNDFIEVSEKTTSINYKIKTQYNPNATNNTITCIVRKNENTYLVNKKIDFGRMGTNGTNQTLVIEADHNAVLMNGAGTYTYRARVYDEQGKDITNGQKFEWSWYSKGTGLPEDLSKNAENNNPTVKDNNLIFTPTSQVSGLYILQVTWSGLTTYLPIALAASKEYQYSGPTEIIYPTTGELEYCNLECKVEGYTGLKSWDLFYYEKKEKEENKVYYYFNKLNAQLNAVEKIWEEFLKNDKQEELKYGDKTYKKTEYEVFESDHIKPIRKNLKLFDYFGSFSNNYFKPIGYYIKSNIFYGIVIEGVWIQPILVLQNKYPSTVVNQWDGAIPTINTEEGYILTPVIAAGKKNDDNTFSGVMIGDMGKLKTDSELSRQTGIYGFHEGAVSYAFKEDGTAYIGKSGKGRIHFDGNESTIKSANYGETNNGGKGMLIDFDDGIIHLRQSGKSKNVNSLPFNINDTTTISWDGTLTSSEVNLTGGKISSGNLELSLDSSNSRFEFFNNENIEGQTVQDFGLIIQAKTEGITNIGTFGFVDLIFKSSALKIYWPKIGTDESGALNIKANTIRLSNTSGETTIKGVLQASDSPGSAIYANFA